MACGLRTPLGPHVSGSIQLVPQMFRILVASSQLFQGERGDPHPFVQQSSSQLPWPPADQASPAPGLQLPACSSVRAAARLRLAGLPPLAMNHGWRQPVGPPPSFEQRLGTRDCDSAIGELVPHSFSKFLATSRLLFSPAAALTLCMQVLRGNVARLFAPGGGDRPFPYNATLFLQDGRRVVVRVFKAAAGRETRLGDGWREIYEDFNLMPGDFAVFAKSVLEDGTFHARFFDADSNERLSRFVAPDPPSSPEFRFRGSSHWPKSPTHKTIAFR